MARTRDVAGFAELAALCTRARVGLQTGQQALARVAVVMAAKGGPVGAVRVGDCVELLQVAADIRATSGSEAHAHSPLFYQLLRAHGDLGEDAPAAIEMFAGRGQPSCEQLIDRYQIACQPMRDVLVDYLSAVGLRPSLDPARRARHATSDRKQPKHEPANPLTGPAPSGMTCGFTFVAGAGFEPATSGL